MTGPPGAATRPTAAVGALLAVEGIRRVYPAGALVFGEGDPPGPTLVVVDGLVEITTIGGRVGRAAAGELIGELSAMDGLPRSASVVALTDLQVRAIAPARFTDLVQRHPALARYVAALLHDRARRPHPMGRGPIGQGAPVSGIARWLLDRCDSDGDWLDPSLDELADAMGASRELLSRAVDHLVGRGAVALDRGRLLIRSRAVLEQLTGETSVPVHPWSGVR